MADEREGRTVLRMMLPGGGSCTVSVSGDFEPRQVRALIRMLEVTADVLDDDAPEEGRRALAAGSADGGEHGT